MWLFLKCKALQFFNRWNPQQQEKKERNIRIAVPGDFKKDRIDFVNANIMWNSYVPEFQFSPKHCWRCCFVNNSPLKYDSIYLLFKLFEISFERKKFIESLIKFPWAIYSCIQLIQVCIKLKSG